MEVKGKGIIFVMRHGPTKNDILNEDLLDEYIDDIVTFIKLNGGIECILTSPIERCDRTASILMEKLNIKIKHKHIHKKLIRIQPDEKYQDVKKRGYEYGNHLREKCTQRNKNILIITHGSLLISLMRGIVPDMDEYMNKENKKLHFCSMSVTQNGKLFLFNKHWNK